MAGGKRYGIVEAGAGKHKRRQRAGERRELARGEAMRGNTIKAMRGIQHGIRMAKTPEDRPRAGHDTINSGTKANAIRFKKRKQTDRNEHIRFAGSKVRYGTMIKFYRGL